MTIGERIKAKREELGLSQEELACRLGYKSRSSVNKIELNQRSLTQSKIKAISDALGTTPSYIMGWSDKENRKGAPVSVPVLGLVRAGLPMEAIENIIDYEEISEEMAHQGDFFALKIKGDSMEPKFSEGDVVVVRKQADVESGDIAIVLVNGDDATIKKVQKFEGGINLVPSNPVYEVRTFTNQQIEELPVQILGKVVELRAKF